METLGYILLFTLLGSVVSLVGGVLLLSKEQFALKISHFLTAFAAGTLLGTAFFDLLPEAAHDGGEETNVFFWTLVGMLILFLTERFIHWFHHHQDQTVHKDERNSILPLVVISDTIHNFIDGVVIAATFMVSIPLGVVTTLAVIAHEIPQEIGDFGIMLHRGMRKKKIILVNLVSALAAVVGALISYLVGASIGEFLPVFLAIAAGFFIYIASSDLIPEIHHEDKRTVALIETLLLLVGVGIIWLLVSLFEH